MRFGSAWHTIKVKGVKTMSVITISRDFGSEGDYIAEKVAQILGYHFVDKEFFSKVLSQYGLIEFDEEYDVLPGFWEKLDPHQHELRGEVVDMLNRIIRAVAQHGNVVILGRSGFEVLEEFADMVNVRLQAPIPLRIRRVMTEMKIPFEQAEEVVKENDKVHIAFAEEYYKIPWDALHVFDLAINTGKISPDMAIAWVVDTVHGLSMRYGTDKPSVRSLEVDKTLQSTVSEVLNCTMTHTNEPARVVGK
jgi:cytidylate kinase